MHLSSMSETNADQYLTEILLKIISHLRVYVISLPATQSRILILHFVIFGTNSWEGREHILSVTVILIWECYELQMLDTSIPVLPSKY
jgi:hypothetical protein